MKKWLGKLLYVQAKASENDLLCRMCRDILNTCIRNTEEAERNAQPASASSTSGRGQGKGVWGMIEESKLAKTFRKDEEKKLPDSLLFSGSTQSEGDVVVQAQQCRDQLQELLARSTPSEGSASETQADLELLERATALLPALAEIIGACSDSARLDELLSLNDTLISLVAHASPKPRDKIQGLGIEVNGLRSSLTDINRADDSSNVFDNHVVTPRGDAEEPTDDDSLSTPRLDKGKGKAPPEPEIVEPVLSPRGFAVADSDEEEHEAEHEGEDDPRSPTDL
jgi:protein phosphatase 1 regulatory subunit 37